MLLTGNKQKVKPTLLKTSLAKADHYAHNARIPNLVSKHSDPNHLKNCTNCSMYHCKAILKISSKSAHNCWSNGRILNRQSIWLSGLIRKSNHEFLLSQQTLHKISSQPNQNLLTDRQK